MHWQQLVGNAPPEYVGDGGSDLRRHGDWYVKFPGPVAGFDDFPPDLQPLVEYLAYRLYARFGIKIPAACLIHDGHQLGLATRRLRGVSLGAYLRSRGWDLEEVNNLPAARDVHDGFFVDVLLANWDVIGLTGNNLILTPEGIYRIDPGGALTFRAQGARKEDAFGPFPGELTTMRDPRIGPAGRVFCRMSAAAESHAAALFRAVSWREVLAVLETVREETLVAVEELTQRDRAALVEAIGSEFVAISAKLAARYAAICA
jgi:hypothetical protein